MAIGNPEDIAPDCSVHRLGGSSVQNLRLSPADVLQDPPGISVLLGGSPQAAAEQMRKAFPRSRKWQTASRTVGTTTVAAIRAAGFEIVPDKTDRFPNHARLISPEGLGGFDGNRLETLAQAFKDTTEC